jgi:hypothetical protein
MSGKGEYHFARVLNMDNVTWKIYELEELGNPPILHPETFIPFKPINPIRITKQIGVCGDRVREFPSVIPNGQVVKCVSCEDSSIRLTITT